MPPSMENFNGASTPEHEVHGGFNGQSSPQDGLFHIARDKSMPIAVVGMSFRGPADATSIEGLWRMIAEGREGWSRIPKDRWNNDGFYHPDNTRHGTINVEGGHFFSEDLARFDAPFFNMTSDEAAALDPQQRLLLEGAFEAFENAGLPLQKVAGSKTSCFVGSFSGDYTDMLLRDPDCIPMYQCTNAGQSRAITANRISYFFDLKGPSVTIDTACSGSLVALHLACQSLRTGDAKMSVAAGVNTILSHEFMSTMSMMKFLSPDGRCYTFDERGNGYARGEGAGILILKPLIDALRDHDTIRAVIRGTGSNQDGRTSGITLPSGEAQEALIRDVYESAGLDPRVTEFVEAHGTGTQAGDPIETGTLARVFGPGRAPNLPLRIGSIKTNVGHMEGASGIGGVIKAVLMLQSRVLLPNRNFETLNPRISLDESKQKVQLILEPWETPGSHRVSVNSFGYGGSNAHAVLEDTLGYLSSRGLGEDFPQPIVNGRNGDYLQHRTSHMQETGTTNSLDVYGHNGFVELSEYGDNDGRKRRVWLCTLSGFDEASSETQIQRLREYLESKVLLDDERFLMNLAYTLNERRTNFTWRTAFSGSTVGDLTKALSNVKPKRANKKPIIGFVFTGQGAQWCGMGKELLDAYPVFRNTIDRITRYLKSINAPFSVREEITRDPKGSQIDTALYSQPMCSAIQIALIELLHSWGIKPASVTGHSSGEIASAYATGALSLEDAMTVAYYRGTGAHEMQQSGQSTKGAMMAVGMTEKQAELHLSQLTKGRAVIACINSPSSMTISGDEPAIDELKTKVDKEGIFARKLAVEVAYHSHHMKPVSIAYWSNIAHVEAMTQNTNTDGTAGEVEVFSSVTGSIANPSDLGPDYWVSNMVGQVKFADSLRMMCLQTSNSKGRARKTRARAGAAAKATVDLLIEIGPHSALQGPIQQICQADEKLKGNHIAYASALLRKNSALKTTLALAEKLFTMGYPVNLSAINLPSPIRPAESIQSLTDLPPYPWNHTRAYWAEPRVSKVYRTRKYPRTDLLGVPDRHASEREPRWRNHIRVQEIPWAYDHKIQSNIVYPAAGYLAMALEATKQTFAERSLRISGYSLRDVSIESAMVLTEQAPTEVLVSLWPHGTGATDTFSDWHEFRVESVSEFSKWTQHCSGLVAAKYAMEHADDSSSLRGQTLQAQELHRIFAEANTACTTDVDIPAFYNHLARLGLEYGDTFANMTAARSGIGTCRARVKIADISEHMPMNFQYPFIIHPTTLDGILHPIFAALSADSTVLENPAIPVSIEELYLSHGLDATPGHEVDVVASIIHRDQTKIVSNIDVISANIDSQTHLSIRELTLQMLDGDGGANAALKSPPIAYTVQWAPDVDLIPMDTLPRVCGISTEDDSVSWTLFEQCVAKYIQEAVQLLDQHDLDAMSPHLHAQWSRLTKYVDSFYSQFSERDNKPDDSVISKTRNFGPTGALLTTIGDHLLAIFRKQVDVSAILNVSTLLERYWSEDLAVIRSYEAVARYLKILGHKNPQQSILEMNAGSGAAASVILKILVEDNRKAPGLQRYTVTDPDSSELDLCSRRLSTWQDLVTVKPFNVFLDLKEQQTQPNSFDIVILARGIAMLPGKHRTLNAAYTLLKPGGRLIAIDAIDGREAILRDFVCGMLPEFWTSESDLVSSVGRWSRDQWHDSLQKAQFSGLHTCLPTNTSRPDDGAYLIMAQAKPPNRSTVNKILIIAEEGECSVPLDSLRQFLAREQIQVDLASWWDAQPDGRLCIVLSELKDTILAHPDLARWEKIQQVFLKSSGILWVVRGGTGSSPNPNAGLSFGFARTARSELGESRIVTLDLDPRITAASEEEARIICKLALYQLMPDRNGDTFEPEYAVRNGDLLIPRVVENSALDKTISSYLGVAVNELQPLYQPNRQLRALVEKAKQWETIRFVEHVEPSPLPDDFIGIEVCAVGLTYKDLQTAEFSLGSECSGVVSTIGTSVKGFSIGDRVACVANGSVANYYYNRSSAFQKIPDELSFALAAAVPVAYTTAYYVVYKLAQLAPTDRVLILGATEPSGQAMFNLCHLRGTEIFATVDSQAGLDTLTERFGVSISHIFYGKDDSVIKAINRETNGRGVDVVINVAGANSEQLRLSWRCIAPYGRFINLAGGDTSYSSRLDMASFSKDAVFASFDLDNLVKERPDMADRTWADVMCLLRSKAIKDPEIPTQYPFLDLDRALKRVEAAATIPGKVVVTAEPGCMVKAVQQVKETKLFHATSSYMLVGGLGGIGRKTAMWMVEHGARYLVFVNRRGTTRKEVRETVEALESKGAIVKVCACDISDEGQVTETLEMLSREAPPIKGVIQAAMLLRDGYIEKTSVEDYLAVLQPKFNGTWNLHNHLPKGLDFFVMLSSISGVIGNATQAAYAAGSSFMDAFAAYRNSLGLPAVSLDLGVIGQVGYLSENKDLATAMERQGFYVTDPQVLLALIQSAIAEPRRQGTQAQTVTGLGTWVKGQSLANFDAPLFAQMRRRFLHLNPSSTDDESAGGSLSDTLSACTSLDHATAAVLSALTRHLAGRLSIPGDDIDAERAPSEYGVNSLVAVELRKWFATEIQSSVPMLEIIASSSLGGLARKVAEKSKLVVAGKEEVLEG